MKRYVMRIGILIKDFEQLANWELRIIQEIINDKGLELVLLVQDGRKGDSSKNAFSRRFPYLFSTKSILIKIIFKLQIGIEERFFHEDSMSSCRNQITRYLKTIPIIKTRPQRKNFVDLFSLEDSNLIKGYNLDIILRHEFGIIRGEILNAAKYGVWSFHHGDNSINRGGPPGFWEIMLKEQYVGVTLQKLTPELDGGLVIDKAYFNLHWSFVKTRNLAFEASVSLLLKSINQLKNNNLNLKRSPIYFNPLYKSPNMYFGLKYLGHFYYRLFRKILEKTSSFLFGTRFECWTLFLGKGEFLNSTLFRLKPIKSPRNEFWADPFLFRKNGAEYVFFENYSYKKKIGKISCGKIIEGKVTEVIDVLNLNYHLSFPFVIEEEGEIFLIPETSENARLEVYKCVQFPSQWQLYSTAFEGELVADTVYYKDKQGGRWLFMNKKVAPGTTLENELFIYKIDSLELKKIQPHSQNPVIIDSRVARNAGAIFEFNNEIYRPSQRNIEGVYGRALSINKIQKLTVDEYKETNELVVEPNFHKGLSAMHHMHQISGMFVFDAAYRRKF